GSRFRAVRRRRSGPRCVLPPRGRLRAANTAHPLRPRPHDTRRRCARRVGVLASTPAAEEVSRAAGAARQPGQREAATEAGARARTRAIALTAASASLLLISLGFVTTAAQAS